jgi:hypothetical protein
MRFLFERWRQHRVRGYLFVASAEEVGAMDLEVGPTRPMSSGARGKAAVPLRDLVPPYSHPPGLFVAMVRVIGAPDSGETMQVVREAGHTQVWRFPSAVTDELARLTPDRPEETLRVIATWAARVAREPEVPARYAPSGLESAFMSLRVEALKALPRDGTRELYYFAAKR